MARGKHASQAARQRYEATLVVVDRLTDKTAELKVRTRQVESLAMQVEPLRKRVAELERQLAGEETARLSLLRDAYETKVAELEDKLVLAAAVFNSVFSAASSAMGDDLFDAMREAIEGDIRFGQLVSDFGFMSFSGLNRSDRRNMQKVSWASEQQDNLQARAVNTMNKKRRLDACGDAQSGDDTAEWYCLTCDALGFTCVTCNVVAKAQQ